VTEAEELVYLRRLVAWLGYRSREALYGLNSSERDWTLSEVLHWTGKYREYLDGVPHLTPNPHLAEVERLTDAIADMRATEREAV